MAIGPVGNAIFVNQQMASVASDKNAALNRFDLQNVAASEAANAKKKEVEEVRPTEKNHEVDPDREHQKQEAESENPKDRDNDENSDEDNDNTNENQTPITHLDIKV